MRHRLGGFRVIARQCVEAHLDAGRDHQPVVGQSVAVAQAHHSGLGVDGCRWRKHDGDAGAGDFLVAELLGRERAQAAEHGVAQRKRRVDLALGNKRHREPWIDDL